jgi:hypothetical protein
MSEDAYDAIDDIKKSVRVGFAAVRDRIARGGPPWQVDVCPRCGGPTVHYCSWVCVDICPTCDAY